VHVNHLVVGPKPGASDARPGGLGILHRAAFTKTSLNKKGEFCCRKLTPGELGDSQSPRSLRKTRRFAKSRGSTQSGTAVAIRTSRFSANRCVACLGTWTKTLGSPPGKLTGGLLKTPPRTGSWRHQWPSPSRWNGA